MGGWVGWVGGVAGVAQRDSKYAVPTHIRNFLLLSHRSFTRQVIPVVHCNMSSWSALLSVLPGVRCSLSFLECAAQPAVHSALQKGNAVHCAATWIGPPVLRILHCRLWGAIIYRTLGPLTLWTHQLGLSNWAL